MPLTSIHNVLPHHAGLCNTWGASTTTSSSSHPGLGTDFHATDLLMVAAPVFFPRRPAGASVSQTSLAIVRHVVGHAAVHRLPDPVTVHLHVLPDHARARIH
eukprot:Skav214417  [mRNA]  locus=scaffold586:197522:198946:- [translate_table: standard]